MTTALGFYFPRTLPRNFEHSDFSYSYSDLPLGHSELNCERSKKFRCDKKNNNVSFRDEKCDKTACRKSVEFAPNVPDLLNDVHDSGYRAKKKFGPSHSFSRVEGLRKKIEFQSRLTKSLDKCEPEKSSPNPLGSINRRNKKNSIDKYGYDENANNTCYVKGDTPDKDSDKIASSVQNLRNSIFYSLKLPRKSSNIKMSSQQPTRDSVTGRNYINVGLGSLQSSLLSSSKRKSAVELLAESKAFYVKSETVLDRKQELPLRVNSTLCTGTNSGTHYATLSGRHRRGMPGEPLQNQLRRLLGSSSTQSPNTLQDIRGQTPRYNEKVTNQHYEWDTTSHPPLGYRSHYNSGTFSANSSSGTSGSKGQVKSDPEPSRGSGGGPYSTKSLNRPSSSGDNRIFFPDSFVVPKPSKSDPANVFSNSFSIESPYSSPEKIDARQILSVVNAYDTHNRPDSKNEYYDDRDLLDYCTISPPAEYAVTERSNYRYVRSNSHSHATKNNNENTYSMNFNSHKSLPDLHKQADRYAETGSRLVSKAESGHYLTDRETSQNLRVPSHSQAVRSNEALSYYSKATSGHSYRSSSKGSDGYFRRSGASHSSDHIIHNDRGSADEVYFYNRSGSSYNRDSGGSSGHCSGPLGPSSLRGIPTPPNVSIQQRRDSGSSTQHSSTRSHRYSSYCVNQYQDSNPNETSHLEYHVSAPLQFQDGIQFNHGSSNGQLNVNATVSISTNFAPRNDVFRNAGNSHVESSQPPDRQALVGIHFQASIPPVQFQDTQQPMYGYNGSYSAEGFFGRRESGTRESRHLLTRRPASSGGNQVTACFEDGSHSLPYEVEGSPPTGLGNFKRQRCLRYKHRSTPRRPILRSKSDISDRYWKNDEKVPPQVDKSHITPPSSDNNSPNHAARIKLDKFFDQLGMDDETYKEVILKDLKKPRRKKKTKTSPKHNSNDDSNSNSKTSDNDEASDELSSSFASSDFSFPDSNLIPNNADYTVQGIQNDNKPYRSYEPLSIVERNARIIKWLCNCRKLQAV